MTDVTVRQACRKLMHDNGLSEWQLKFVDKIDGCDATTQGLCEQVTKTIYITKNCTDKPEDICRHEIAHAITREFDHHGPKWADTAWHLAGCPPGGTPCCPEPKCISDLFGHTTYASLLKGVIEEAKCRGATLEEFYSQWTLCIDGGNLSEPLPGYYFCIDELGNALIHTQTGMLYVSADILVPEIVAAMSVLSKGFVEQEKWFDAFIEKLRAGYPEQSSKTSVGTTQTARTAFSGE